MVNTSSQLEKLREAAGAVCSAHGLALVDARFINQRGKVLQVLIERPGSDPATGAGVSVTDCQALSRDLSTALDVDDSGEPGASYRLEVGSPGLERPLLSLEDFQRFSGREAKIATHDAMEGRRHFTGRLIGVDGQTVRIAVDGDEYPITHANIAKAHLVHRF